jgi:hypothetical protein
MVIFPICVMRISGIDVHLTAKFNSLPIRITFISMI